LLVQPYGVASRVSYSIIRGARARQQRVLAVEMYGEEDFGRALDNTPEQQLFEIGAWLLGEHLKASDHNYVMLDGRVRLAWELADELENL
jgi:hypothetical protein